MYLLTMNCHWRLTYRRCTRIYNVIRPYNHSPDVEKNNMSPTVMKSKIFPDHQILYMFPNIIYPRILNMGKRNQTMLAGASLPFIIGLQAMGFISGTTSIEIIYCIYAFTAIYHAFCFVCNNIIGSIYFQKHSKEVIISYINYWGKRIDLKIDAEDIVRLEDDTFSIPSIFYRTLYIKSPKKKLKISVKYGKILEKKEFSNIFGDVK